ncbi:MAG: hypothetical protein GF364_19730 [Candidatus Lokiarchaeota archaeon]|nr:hypothetical protein [Candidatus Lokiarchaeota archaeon]
MIEELKAELQKLEDSKAEAQPKIDELNKERNKELALVEQRYDALIANVSKDVDELEEKVYNDLIESFEKIVMHEFDAKRSTNIYRITKKLKAYTQFVSDLDMYPKELAEKLQQVVSQEITIEDVAYNVDKLKGKYLK